jgi:putative chitinase
MAALDGVRRAAARFQERPEPTIGWRSLQHVCPMSDEQAHEIAKGLGRAFRRYDITTPQRAAMAVAQMAHESDRFRTSTEDGDGAAYEGRRELGNLNPGDGRRYRGRGRIQCTGRRTYAAAAKEFGIDFLAQPERVAQHPYSELVSAWWWQAQGCNELADAGDFVAVTRRIDGGISGLAEREAYYARARQVARHLTPR